MKHFRRTILFSALIMITGLTSCFDEKDDDYKIIGPVGTAVILTTIVDPLTGLEKAIVDPVAGQQIKVTVRYYSEFVAVKQVKLSVSVDKGTAAELWTMEVTEFDTKNSYERKIDYVVPAIPSKTEIKFTAEIVTVNELTNTGSGTIAVK